MKAVGGGEGESFYDILFVERIVGGERSGVRTK
jgi:hypothetical protein